MNVTYYKVDFWEELTTKLRIVYPQLTDADLQYKQGTERSMLRMIEYKLRKTKQEMLEILAGIGFYYPPVFINN
jgi:hypothetical protein